MKKLFLSGGGYLFNSSVRHFHSLHIHLEISLVIAHLRTLLAAEMERGIFGFRAQVTNHQAMRPFLRKQGLKSY